MTIIDQSVGQIERKTQDRIVTLFRDKLEYTYLGNWEDREQNSNINEDLLRTYLKSTHKYSDKMIDKAITELKKITSNQILSLFEIN